MTKSAQNDMLLKLHEASLQREIFETQEKKVKRSMNVMATILIISIVLFIGCQLYKDSAFANSSLDMFSKHILNVPYVALLLGVVSLFWLLRSFLKIISLEPETSKARKFESLLIRKIYHVLAVNSNGNYNF